MGYYINSELGYYEGDQSGPFDVAVPPRPDSLHVWQDGDWVVPLADAQAARIAAINVAADAELAAITRPYPPSEVNTWPQQYAEAQAVTANASALTPMLSAIAIASGQTVAALAAVVMAKAALFQATSGAIVGKRIALTAEIEASATVDAVQAVSW